jgi:hypothetical protein
MRAVLELIGASVLTGFTAYGAYKFFEYIENKGKEKK